MSNIQTVTITKTYPAPVFCETEILRYAGCRKADEDMSALLCSCIREVQNQLTYQVCYQDFPLTVTGDDCDCGVLRVHSGQLARRLFGCKGVILFAATVGVKIDRLIAKYGRLSPSRALMLQAIGAERIEALCNAFCADMAGEKGGALRPRFSPGYGDLPLTLQKELFAVLDCGRRIGLFLNDSLLMSPSKSVTAFVGYGGEDLAENRCGSCGQTNCFIRGAK